MKPYPEYKETGLSWLPKIPKHWNWLFLSQISEEQKIKNIAAKEKNVLSLSYGNIIRKKNLNGGLTPQDWATYQIVFPGNIILRLTDLQNDHTSLRTGLVKEQGIITSAYTCLKTSHNSAFLHYLLHAYDIQKVFYGFGGGVRQSIGYKALRNLCFPVPSPDEQAQIVRYLDAMTAKINKLIRAKKKQIALLFEEITTLANVILNDSTLPRIRLKNIVHLVENEITREDEIYYSPIGVLNRGRGIFHKAEAQGKDLGDSTFFYVYPGDLIFSGQFAWEGAVAIIQESENGCIASHRYPMIRANDNSILLEFLWAFFQTKYGDIILNLHSHGAAGRNRPLNIMELLTEVIPIPDMEKQQEIANIVKKMNNMRILEKQYAGILHDYKNSLISAVVTGKMDIRGLTAEDVVPEDVIVDENTDEQEDDNIEEIINEE